MTFGDQEFESLQSRLGWQISARRDLGNGNILTPQLRVGWDRENLDRVTNANASLPVFVNGAQTGTFGAALNTVEPGSDWMFLGAGVAVKNFNGGSVLLDYQGQYFRDDAHYHHVQLRFGKEF